MRSQKPRPAGSVYEAITKGFAAIGAAEGAPEHGVRLVAEFEAKAEPTVYRWTDPDAEPRAEMSLVRAQRLARKWPAFAAVMADFFANLAGGNFVPRQRPGTDRRWLETSAETVEDMGRVLVLVVRATSPDSPGGERLAQREAQGLLPLLIEVRENVDDMITDVRLVAEGRE